ncbi:MAG: hypothetical protein AAF628_36575 [Planctomycetota bacterium]
MTAIADPGSATQAKSTSRPFTTLLLLAAIAVLLWLIPWSRLGGVPFAEVAEERLNAQLAAYTDLRVNDDWVTLYEMTSPADREIVDRTRFLQMYGAGVMRVHGVKTNSIDIDAEKRTAKVQITVDGEIVPERLPPHARNGFQIEDPSKLRQQSPVTLTWVWSDEQWYWEMDAVVKTGMNPQGKATKPLR